MSTGVNIPEHSMSVDSNALLDMQGHFNHLNKMVKYSESIDNPPTPVGFVNHVGTVVPLMTSRIHPGSRRGHGLQTLLSGDKTQQNYAEFQFYQLNIRVAMQSVSCWTYEIDAFMYYLMICIFIFLDF